MRAGFALALAAVLTLPYVSPVVCKALDREMTMTADGMGAAIESDQMANGCDVLDCATAAVAPVATASLVMVVRPLAGRDLPAAPRPPHDNTVPPVTPPPQA